RSTKSGANKMAIATVIIATRGRRRAATSNLEAARNNMSAAIAIQCIAISDWPEPDGSPEQTTDHGKGSRRFVWEASVCARVRVFLRRVQVAQSQKVGIGGTQLIFSHDSSLDGSNQFDGPQLVRSQQSLDYGQYRAGSIKRSKRVVDSAYSGDGQIKSVN